MSMPNSQFAEISALENIVREKIEGWKRDRKRYPGWIVLPDDQRKRLWDATFPFVQTLDQCFISLKPEIKVVFLHELSWRYQKCLAIMPAFIYQEIGQLIENRSFWTEFRSDNTNKNYGIWFDLAMTLLQYFRLHGSFRQYNKLIAELESEGKVIALFDQEQSARWHYEKVLYALYSLDMSQMQKELDSWTGDPNLPIWEAKRASFYVELGNLYVAREILSSALLTIRKQINLSVSATKNINLISQEGIILLALLRVETWNKFDHDTNTPMDSPQSLAFPRHHILETLTPNVYQVPNQQFSHDSYSSSTDRKAKHSRLEAIQEQKADIRVHLGLYSTALEQPPTNTVPDNIEPSFDLAEVIDSSSYHAQDQNDLLGVRFMLLLEETGIPYRIQAFTYEINAVVGAIKRINLLHPWWAIITLFRIGEAHHTDIQFSRESLAVLSLESIDEITKRLLYALKWCDANLGGSNPLLDVNLPVRLARILPELLSRLCTKCSHELQKNILDALLRLYYSQKKDCYRGIQNLIKRLIVSWPKDKNSSLILKLCEFPDVGGSDLIALGFVDPLAFFQGKIVGPASDLVALSQKIDQILYSCKSDIPETRMRSLSKAYQLYNACLFNPEHISRFGEILWKDASTDLPQDTGFYQCHFLRLPCPEGKSRESAFKKFVFDTKFTAPKIPLHDPDPTNLLANLLGGSKTLFIDEGIDWSAEESLEILKRILEWWNVEKRLLTNPPMIPFREVFARTMLARFQYLSRILSDIILPRLTVDIAEDYIELIQKLLKELQEYGVPCNDALVASIPLQPEKKDKILDKLYSDAFSSNSDDIDKAFRGICIALRLEQQGRIEVGDHDLLQPMIDCIQWRRLPGILPAIQFMIQFIMPKIPDKLNPQLSAIRMGLKKLFLETSDHKSQAPSISKDRIALRYFGMQLASNLFKYCFRDRDNMPDEIRCWHDITQSQNEFWDIRNQWEQECTHGQQYANQ